MPSATDFPGVTSVSTVDPRSRADVRPAARVRIAVRAVRVGLLVNHRLVDGGDDASVPVGDGQAVAIAVRQHRWIVVRINAKFPGVLPKGDGFEPGVEASHESG